MKFVWDEPKRQANIVTHELDLVDVESFDWETVLLAPGHADKKAVAPISGHRLVRR